MNVTYIENKTPIQTGHLDTNKSYYMIIDNDQQEKIDLGKYIDMYSNDWQTPDLTYYDFEKSKYIPFERLKNIYEYKVVNVGSRRSKRNQRRSKRSQRLSKRSQRLSKGGTKKRHRRKRQV